jgi:hypothetical protein
VRRGSSSILVCPRLRPTNGRMKKLRQPKRLGLYRLPRRWGQSEVRAHKNLQNGQRPVCGAQRERIPQPLGCVVQWLECFTCQAVEGYATTHASRRDTFWGESQLGVFSFSANLCAHMTITPRCLLLTGHQLIHFTKVWSLGRFRCPGNPTTEPKKAALVPTHTAERREAFRELAHATGFGEAQTEFEKRGVPPDTSCSKCLWNRPLLINEH